MMRRPLTASPRAGSDCRRSARIRAARAAKSVEGFGRGAIREAINALGTANLLRGLSLEQQHNLLDLFTCSAGEMLDERFESDLVKALFGFDAIVGNYASPYAAGSAYVMLHHAFGEVNGKKGVWGHAIGGMGAITQAMARAAREAGADITLEAGVREVIVEKDRAVGVVLDSGETIRAKFIAANVNPKLLYTRLVPSGALAPEFLTRMNRWRNGSGTFRMNVALGALPSSPRCPVRATISPPASSWHQVSAIWTAPGRTHASMAGAARRSWRC